jgi:hypothetical protein
MYAVVDTSCIACCAGQWGQMTLALPEVKQIIQVRHTVDGQECMLVLLHMAGPQRVIDCAVISTCHLACALNITAVIVCDCAVGAGVDAWDKECGHRAAGRGSTYSFTGKSSTLQ